MRRLLVGLGSAAAAVGLGAFAASGNAAARESSGLGPVDGDPLGLHEFDYDVVVIGGGSGGLAAAKRAASHGAKVALCDFVVPTNHGTTWGLGGTCVNVGCIPKKLMHTSALIGESVNHDAAFFGHTGPKGAALQSTVSWETLQQNVENYIRSLNFGYTTSLRSSQVQYKNAFARFVEPHVIECTDKKGQTSQLSARRFILAPGGRPSKMGIPGEEHAITSDDLFRLKKDPKKTLVVGGGYIALECAGFLHGIGRSATVMMRSVPLRTMDQDMAGRVAKYMELQGIPLLRHTVPTAIEKKGNGKLVVTFKDAEGATKTDEYDTVLMAIGRDAQVKGLDLDKAGVELSRGKLVVDKYNRTSTEHIYALGDAIKGGLELTPVAIKAGNALADRLYNRGTAVSDMRGVPTTVFTPLEYGFVGLSEEQAREEHGDDVDAFHQEFQPLEWALPHRPNDACYMKIVVQPSTDRVLGFHVVGPNAGEMTQGVGVALKAGATKRHFDETIGIHPTAAETMSQMVVTKSSGADAGAGGGC